jgi:D-3-phosphoglycerate dehydrogenase
MIRSGRRRSGERLQSDAGQYFQTGGQIGYVVLGADGTVAPAVLKGLRALPGTIRARMLYTRQ